MYLSITSDSLTIWAMSPFWIFCCDSSSWARVHLENGSEVSITFQDTRRTAARHFLQELKPSHCHPSCQEEARGADVICAHVICGFCLWFAVTQNYSSAVLTSHGPKHHTECLGHAREKWKQPALKGTLQTVLHAWAGPRGASSHSP